MSLAGRKARVNKYSIALCVITACICAVLAAPVPAGAAWSNDPDNPVMVNDAYLTNNCRPQAVAAGGGSFIVVWSVKGPIEALLAQKFDKNGDPVWPDTVGVFGDYNYFNEAVTDGHGGVVVSWTDGDDFYCQRVDSNGNVLWGTNGVRVLENTDEAWLAPDGDGGAYLFDYDNAVVVRVDSDGNLAWDPVKVSENGISATKIVADGEGGAIMVWEEGSYQVAVQRVDENGNLLWNNGEPLHVAENGYCPRIAATGDGSAVVTWIDDETYPNGLLAQKIDADGNLVWDEGGVLISEDVNDDSYPEPAADGEGGAFIVFDDYSGLYAVHCGQDGSFGDTMHFISDTFEWVHNHPRHTIEDGSGGVITAWFDTDDNLYIQRLDKNCEPVWEEGGVLLASYTGATYGPRVALSLDKNKGGGVAVIWVGYPGGGKVADKNIYMQYIGLDGTLGRFFPGNAEEAEEDYSQYIGKKKDKNDRYDCFIGTAATGQGGSLGAMVAALIAAGATLLRTRRNG